MNGYCRVVVLGTLGRDVEVKTVGNKGTAMCNLSLAVSRKYQDKEETTWVPVTLWGKTAEIAGKYLSKGSQVLIEGRLTLDEWTDKNNGEKRSKLKVTGDSMTMVGSPRRGSRDAGDEAQPQWRDTGEESQVPPSSQVDDDTPF